MKKPIKNVQNENAVLRLVLRGLIRERSDRNKDSLDFKQHLTAIRVVQYLICYHFLYSTASFIVQLLLRSS